MPTISVGNSRVHYTVTGEGPALVLVHGVGKGGQVTFGHLVEDFARRNTVILPELSGSETAEDDGTALTVEQLADEVAAVIEHAGLGPVDLVGFSLGGAVVAATAALHPGLVRRLVPIGGLVKSDLYIENLIGLTLSQKHDAKAFGRVLSTTAFSPRYIRTRPSLSDVENLGSELSPSNGRIRQLELLVQVDIRDIVGKVEAETLVLAPYPDAAVPAEHSRELAAAIPNSSYTEIDSGHMVIFERPAELVQLIQDFIHRA
ncbi:alpha/beta fold hydrolase [Kitasatospora purpeofusca]|uniref:alpha/beta fold hydrolase n=1 Tax=Kitasatospora purpeofusca TaxID=67352 RepID=UPI00225A4184|nr:alpha/beta hydrolase [Kitasatospora purpeofusca]MCX4757026.1 alpha/beta hydrolase [Kitasatospora purpeofusca]WSR35209.1 alpha/beta hydrolase [Kitasatospora purpeofusca]WSR43530.1 alpha/beta hydrolase [Kitasatospora purpeofusca]WTA51117.1 alpha/beta hydrolase [Kitasatospora purpeofusca]